MQSFQSLFEHAAKRKGGTAALESLLPIPLSSEALTKIPDDRWLAMMSRCIFQAGFS